MRDIYCHYQKNNFSLFSFCKIISHLRWFMRMPKIYTFDELIIRIDQIKFILIFDYVILFHFLKIDRGNVTLSKLDENQS